jgi:uncharacterized protein
VIKILFWVVLLAVVAFVLGFKRGRPPERPSPRRDAPPAPPAPTAASDLEPMVSCAECGTHLPASEALPGRGGVFCSAEHRSAHEARLGAPRADRS